MGVVAALGTHPGLHSVVKIQVRRQIQDFLLRRSGVDRKIMATVFLLQSAERPYQQLAKVLSHMAEYRCVKKTRCKVDH